MENSHIKNYKNLVDELSEDSELDQKIVNSFYSKDDLSSDIFQQNDTLYIMHESIREKLLSIADKFMDFLDVSFFIYDIILTGSLANYNWSEFSDVDLHILLDTNEFTPNNSDAHKLIVKEFLDSKKNIWNLDYNIKIKKYDVEIYIQDVNEKHISSGVYSILNNKWLIEPQKDKHSIDDTQIMSKGEEYAKIIDDLSEKSEHDEDVSDEVDDIKSKIKKFRQCGLEKGGEYSYENLTFKLLRRNGYIKKLLNIKKQSTDKKLSVTQQ